MHVDAGQQVHHVGRLGQRNPVELHIGARGEVGAVLGQERGAQQALAFHRGLEDFGLGLVIFTGNACQHADLRAGNLAIGHGHAQHGRVTLYIPAVLQAQWAEVVFRQLAGLPAFELVTELIGAQLHEFLVEGGVLVHGGSVGKPVKPSL
ncbi:hypothetical protein D3C78_1469350 [compost metagenome]